MDKAERRIGKVCITCASIFSIAIGLFLFAALSYESKVSEAAPSEVASRNNDQGSGASVIIEDKAPGNRLEGGAGARTLSKYYARREYLGSPPVIPHPDRVHGKDLDCLSCHADGGWTALRKKITPVTPHPEMTSCRQCHISPSTAALFKGIDWQSLPPPRLGRSYLPGAPPPIPHDLHMRENCNACHVGPGTLTAIRMKHEWRGICRQCHLPDTSVEIFQR